MTRGADDRGEELGRISSKEKSNYSQGKSGSKVETKPGPVKSVVKNPTKGGGINRATSG